MPVWGQGIPPSHTMNVAHLTKQLLMSLLMTWYGADIVTNILPNLEWIRYVLYHSVRVTFGPIKDYSSSPFYIYYLQTMHFNNNI